MSKVFREVLLQQQIVSRGLQLVARGLQFVSRGIFPNIGDLKGWCYLISVMNAMNALLIYMFLLLLEVELNNITNNIEQEKLKLDDIVENKKINLKELDERKQQLQTLNI